MDADRERWVWVPFEVDKRFDGFRVDSFLAQRLTSYTRSRVQKILEASRVTRDDRPIKSSARVRGGDRILVAYPRRAEEPLPPESALPILYEDDAMLVINKPANLLSHPTDKIHKHTVLGFLRHARPDLVSLHLLHRLDRETSGVLALAKTRSAARVWTETMEKRMVKKEYLAFVRGIPLPRHGIIDLPIGRQEGEIKVRQGINVTGAVPAVTRYEVVASLTQSPDVWRLCEASVVRAAPETGRLHQIRVHLAAIGYPILGDVLYNGDGALYLKMARHQLTLEDRETLGFPRLALHAARLTFPHPVTGQLLNVTAPLPADMADFLKDRGILKIDTLTSQ